ncbi:hypothetical protein Pcinc_019225 [Petrolisthes cinctipes]|uniref:Uncharacterized protein n=1 Tax=Petrolisthes cinctipes TaxID=88211 RepID=A0AAE1KKQ9_PETCI|nr:hypothetical protein Pcinc_019225 [Petrolisthes cinctipes]
MEEGVAGVVVVVGSDGGVCMVMVIVGSDGGVCMVMVVVGSDGGGCMVMVIVGSDGGGCMVMEEGVGVRATIAKPSCLYCNRQGFHALGMEGKGSW